MNPEGFAGAIYLFNFGAAAAAVAAAAVAAGGGTARDVVRYH